MLSLPGANLPAAERTKTTMSSGIRAFSRTRALRGPGRSDVALAMSKWWTKKRPTEGQVRQLQSNRRKDHCYCLEVPTTWFESIEVPNESDASFCLT